MQESDNKDWKCPHCHSKKEGIRIAYTPPDGYDPKTKLMECKDCNGRYYVVPRLKDLPLGPTSSCDKSSP